MRVVLVCSIIGFLLAGCGVQQTPVAQSLAETAAPDEPISETRTPVVPTPVVVTLDVPTTQPSKIAQPTPTQTALPPTLAVPTLVVRQTGQYTLTMWQGQLVAWSPDETELLMLGGGPYTQPLSYGKAFRFNMETADIVTVATDSVEGYSVGSYVYPYQEPEWLASGIRYSRPNVQGIPELVELDPDSAEPTERVVAELGTGPFYSLDDGSVRTITNDTLHQPDAPDQSVMLPTDPNLAWMTQFSDDLLVYVPTSRTITLRTVATGTEQTWSLDRLPDLAELCCIHHANQFPSKKFPLTPEQRADAHIASLSISPNSRYLAFSVAHKQSALDIWVLDIHTQAVHLLERHPEAWGTHLEWSPDSELLAYTGGTGFYKSRVEKLYSPVYQQIVYTANQSVISLVWNTDSTKFATLAHGQQHISIYAVER